ncbi:glutathione S-transferase theta-3-like isoform X1 [Pituophis catenifer annectens]|uniref:glutathione S-transferase theta-3-like isoform X1 n=1 Tax=Pituophis catenifer annectens TaxID=94852 RepID=UPI00399449D1
MQGGKSSGSPAQRSRLLTCICSGSSERRNRHCCHRDPGPVGPRIKTVLQPVCEAAYALYLLPDGRSADQGQHFTEEFNKVNILRKVPVLKDGDFILEESTAILLYLTRKYNTPSYWYPPDMKKRARVDEYLAWQISTIRAGTSKILWLKVVIPLFVGHQVSPEKLYEAMEELNLAIQKLEDKFLQDKPFLIGPEISLADLVAIVELMQVSPPPRPNSQPPKLGVFQSGPLPTAVPPLALGSWLRHPRGSPQTPGVAQKGGADIREGPLHGSPQPDPEPPGTEKHHH